MAEAGAVDPVVSIVLPTYGRPGLLERAVRSVQSQTVTDWELIVVDDNDPDSAARRETGSLMRRLSYDVRIRYACHGANQGGAAARNTGIELARAQIVGFLDDDDEWHAEKLEHQIAAMDGRGPDLALVYCRMRIIDDATGRSWNSTADGTSHTLRQLVRRNTIGSTSCVLCRRSALVDVGMFDSTLPSKQDIDLYVRLAERFTLAFVDRTLVTRHLHDGPSIGKNLDGTILAHQLFFEKHRRHIDAYPDVRRQRLASWGQLLVTAGRMREARPLLWRAWRLGPGDVRTAAHLAVAHGVSKNLLRAVSRLFARAREYEGGSGR